MPYESAACTFADQVRRPRTKAATARRNAKKTV